MSLDYRDKEVRKRIKLLHGVLVDAFVPAALASVQHMARHVTTKKLLGQYLNRVTGTAIRSIMASPHARKVKDGARGVYGSNLDYVKAHNDGFQGIVQVEEHERRIFRHRSLRTGKELKRRQFTGNSVKVRAHTRNVNMRARHFFEDTTHDTKADVRRYLERSIEISVRTGMAPTAEDLEFG